jgi:hypothetical protein
MSEILTDALAPLLNERLPYQPDDASADLITKRRFDAKTIINVGCLPELLRAVDPAWRILEVDGRRLLFHRTLYFDSADLQLFRDHRQGRLRRFKVRIRNYPDGASFLELKLRGAAGRTDKVRRPHVGDGRLSAQDIAWLECRLKDWPGTRALPSLMPSAWTTCARVALLDPDGEVRLSLDLGLQTGRPDQTADFTARHVIVEAKSLRYYHPVHALLRAHGGQSVQLSKYAAAVGFGHGEHINRWQPAVRRLMHVTRIDSTS